MREREWPEEKDTAERVPDEPDTDREPGRTAGGADPLTAEQGEPEASNADIPAGRENRFESNDSSPACAGRDRRTVGW